MLIDYDGNLLLVLDDYLKIIVRYYIFTAIT